MRTSLSSARTGLPRWARIWTLAACLAPPAAAVMASEPVELTDEHIDIRINYTPENETNQLALVLRDEGGQTYSSGEAILVVKESAKISLPGGTPFGEEGADMWVLPQSQAEDLLYIGFSAEGVPGGVFDGPLQITLLSVEAPGHFFAWQAGQFGALNVKMNSADGISEADTTNPAPGSHEHFNFGFSSNGVCRVTFQASGRRIGATTNSVSAPTMFVFHVLPLPPAAETGFSKWQARNWPGGAAETVQGAAADPDGDGIPNMAEYAFALDPKSASREGLPTISVVKENENSYAVLSWRRFGAAADITYIPQAADSLPPGAWLPFTAAEEIELQGEQQIVRMRNPIPISGTERYYRIVVSFVN